MFDYQHKREENRIAKDMCNANEASRDNGAHNQNYFHRVFNVSKKINFIKINIKNIEFLRIFKFRKEIGKLVIGT